MQEFLGSVLYRFEDEKVLVLVDELRVHGAIKELVITQHILEERDICLSGKEEEKKKEQTKQNRAWNSG